MTKKTGAGDGSRTHDVQLGKLIKIINDHKDKYSKRKIN